MISGGTPSERGKKIGQREDGVKMADPGKKELEGDRWLRGTPEIILAPDQDGEGLLQKEDVRMGGKGHGGNAFFGPSIAGRGQRLALDGAVKDIPESSGKGTDLRLGVDSRIQNGPGSSEGPPKVPLQKGGKKGFLQGLVGHAKKFRNLGGCGVGATDAKDLVQNGEAVPKAPFRGSGQE
jgi:hypothetical protein